MLSSCVLLLGYALCASAQQQYKANWESLDQRATPSWFLDAKFGIFIHWGVYSVPSFAAAGVPKEQQYAEWYWHSLTKGRNDPDAPGAATWKFHQRVFGADFPYQNFAPMFRAELFDPDRWAEVLAGSGAKYVVLTSKHHEGFALWPSREASATWERPWNSVEAGPHRDLLGDLGEAVRRKNLKMGFYYSLYEWYNPLWLTDKPRYVREHMHPQFKDVVTRYKPSIIFSDGEWELPSAEWRTPELLAWLFNETSVKDEVVVNDRWGKDTRHKHGGYYTTEYTPGMSGMDHPWEESRGMGFSYGYNRMERLEDYHTGRELVLMLVDLVSRGGNLLLDIGPTADGRIPVIMQQRLHEIGDWLKVNSEAIYGSRPWTQTRQWSAGEQPHVEYNKEFMTAYDVGKLSEKPAAGKASIEAFFTKRGNDVFAILPRWGRGAFTIKDLEGSSLKTVTLLGSDLPLKWQRQGRSVSVLLPDLPEHLAKQPAWVLKLSGPAH
ncbi:MAG: alpha-L-fucosidase [Acidobacteriota bacterium]|nr:alpha-L-fucosidase [Acidobacteriota bacterium]